MNVRQMCQLFNFLLDFLHGFLPVWKYFISPISEEGPDIDCVRETYTVHENKCIINAVFLEMVVDGNHERSVAHTIKTTHQHCHITILLSPIKVHM